MARHLGNVNSFVSTKSLMHPILGMREAAESDALDMVSIGIISTGSTMLRFSI